MFPVFPTPVGVFLLYHVQECLDVCFPHARGGVSLDFTETDLF